MSDAQAERFREYLVERFEGEVFGEAVFAAMAEGEADPDARYKWRVLEALERETKEYLARALRARGCPADESAEKVGEGWKLGRSLVAAPRALFMAGFRNEVLRFVAEYEAAEASVPAARRTPRRPCSPSSRARRERTRPRRRSWRRRSPAAARSGDRRRP